MKKKYIRILISISLLLLVVTIIILYTYKKHRNISTEKPHFELSTKQLINEFDSDVEIANKKFTDKTIISYGKITSLDLKQSIITLDDKLIALLNKEEIKKVKNGEMIKVKGRFIGYDELFEELRMDQCTIEE